MRFVSLGRSAIALALMASLFSVPTTSFGQETPERTEQATPSSGSLGNQGNGLGNDVTRAPDVAGELAAEPNGEAENNPTEPEAKPAEQPVESPILQADDADSGPDAITAPLKNAAVPAADGSAGNLSYDVPIDVPAFRGLEPSLSLSYDSSRKTKLTGSPIKAGSA